MSSYYKHGSWNVICQVCGRQFKSDQVRKRWDGFIVCPSDFEMRHDLDFIRVRPERPSIPYASPEPDDVFVVVHYITERQGIADVGSADFAQADTFNRNL